MNIQKKVFEFNLNIGVPNHDVNSNTFLTSLTCITDIIGLINGDLSPQRKLEVRVRAIQPGSFECSCFIQDAIINGIALLPFVMNLDLHYYKEIIDIVIEILKIKQFLKGEPATKTEVTKDGINIVLTNSKGNTIVIDKRSYNYYTGNQGINDAITKNFEKLNVDNEVSDFGIKTEDKAFFAQRQDFLILQQKHIVDEEKVTEKIYENQSLQMFKLVWDSSNKWGFIWNGVRIQAYIKDANFFKRIDDGEKFAKGDTVQAKLKIYQIYDNTIDGWINDSYEVLEITDHKSRPTQTRMIFEDQID